ncbi:MAG: FecR domain-containing protein [Saprospirales bacterium]|nr:FecR domain-containing protein [Saprospirales bacterium]
MQNFDYILLLSKRFSGEINASEAALLDEWISQSPENERLAGQYQAIWMHSTEQFKAFRLDMDAEFQQLQARLKLTGAPATRTVPIRFSVFRVAAALAFLLLAVWAIRQFTPTAPANMVAEASSTNIRTVDLPDGSRVWLRQNAQLQYPQKFSARERRVQLSGEAYFDVAQRDGQPFRVEMEDGGIAEVLGTTFSVRASKNDPETSVLVCSGKVRFSPDGKSRGAVLLPNKKGVFNRQTAQLRVLEVPTLNELAWQTGGLEFIRTPLETVLDDLETHYQVKIELLNPALLRCLHTAPQTNQPIQQVLETLSLTYQLQISNPSPGHFILSGGKCQ